MPTRLTGNPTLSYMGVNAPQPPNIATYKRAPTANDWQNFIIGDIWLNTTPTPATAREIWMLVALLHNQATWIMLSNPGALFLGLDGDTGITAVPTIAGIINVLGGANINTVGTANTITVNLDTSILQPATTADQSAGVYSVGGVPYLHGYGVTNVFVGGAGNFTLNNVNARANVGIGYGALASLVGSGLNLGDANVAIGYQSLNAGTDCGNNVVIGFASAPFLTTGSYNVILGQQAGQTYVGDESDNILIGHVAEGVGGETNTLHIGKVTGSATGDGQLKAAYICGIQTTAGTPAANAYVTMVDTNNLVYGLPNGNATFVLTSNGAALAPTWQAAPAGTVTTGTWAPTIAWDQTVPASTFTTSGTWVKAGPSVFFTMTITKTSGGAGGSGSHLRITNMPYACTVSSSNISIFYAGNIPVAGVVTNMSTFFTMVISGGTILTTQLDYNNMQIGISPITITGSYLAS